MAVPKLISNADGTIAEANDAALTLLRATLEQLRELPPGALSPEPPDPNASEAFREEWERQGSPDVGGEGTVRRLDGTTVRVKFGITPMDDGRFLVLLEEVAAVIAEKSKARPPVLKFVMKESPCYIGRNKDEPKLIAKVNEIIAKAKSSGELNKISQKWLKADLPANL